MSPTYQFSTKSVYFLFPRDVHRHLVVAQNVILII